MQFEWDAAKAAGNLAKHGVRFDEASEVFADSQLLLLTDQRKDYGEDRFIALGRTPVGLLLVVVHTPRQDTCRIISARRANHKERQIYVHREI